MPWDTVSKILLAALPVLAVLATGLRDRFNKRSRLKADLELLPLIPVDAPAYEQWRSYIDRAVANTIARESELRRDPFGAVLALTFLAAAAAMAYTATSQQQPYWWIGTAFLGLFGVVGLAQDGVPRRRDERGRPIKPGKPSTDTAT